MSQEQIGTISGSVYDVYTEDQQRYKEGRVPRVGQTVEFEDGRKFVFCHSNSALSARDVVSCDVPTLCDVVGEAAKAGMYKVEIKRTGATANQYANGYLVTKAHSYKIKSNTATDTSGNIVVTLYDKLKEDLSESVSDSTILKSFRNSNVVRSDGTGDSVGVSLADVDAGVDTYFWVQYKGIGVANAASAPTDGASVKVEVGGEIADAAAATDVIVGQALKSDGVNGSILIKLDFPG